MRISQARYVIVKSFFPSLTCLPSENDPRNECRESYTYCSVLNEKASVVAAFHHTNSLPIVLDGDGAVWPEANYYLYSKFTDLEISRQTYKSLAKDLALFKRYIEVEGLSFDCFPESKLERVTYRYRFHLICKINGGELSPSTGRRLMSSVIGLYQWSMEHGIIEPENSPWVTRDRLVMFTDLVGIERSKKIQTTDLSIKVPEVFDFETISDGGRLKPLSESEQYSLLVGLSKLNNSEMILTHCIALFTGARLQTVLTLRVKNFQRDTYDMHRMYQIPVGSGTGVDTKKGKRYTLIVPGWLMEALYILL